MISCDLTSLSRPAAWSSQRPHPPTIKLQLSHEWEASRYSFIMWSCIPECIRLFYWPTRRLTVDLSSRIRPCARSSRSGSCPNRPSLFEWTQQRHYKHNLASSEVIMCESVVMLLMERNDWQTCTLQVIQPVEVRAWDRPGVNWRSPVRLIPRLSCMYFSILWISLVFLASALTQSFLLSRRTVRKYLRCCDHRDNSTTFRMQMHGIYLFLQSDILIFFGCTGYFYVNVRHR